jgi:hypothetical protein
LPRAIVEVGGSLLPWAIVGGGFSFLLRAIVGGGILVLAESRRCCRGTASPGTVIAGRYLSKESSLLLVAAGNISVRVVFTPDGGPEDSAPAPRGFSTFRRDVSVPAELNISKDRSDFDLLRWRPFWFTLPAAPE